MPAQSLQLLVLLVGLRSSTSYPQLCTPLARLKEGIFPRRLETLDFLHWVLLLLFLVYIHLLCLPLLLLCQRNEVLLQATHARARLICAVTFSNLVPRTWGPGIVDDDRRRLISMSLELFSL